MMTQNKIIRLVPEIIAPREPDFAMPRQQKQYSKECEWYQHPRKSMQPAEGGKGVESPWRCQCPCHATQYLTWIGTMRGLSLGHRCYRMYTAWKIPKSSALRIVALSLPRGWKQWREGEAIRDIQFRPIILPAHQTKTCLQHSTKDSFDHPLSRCWAKSIPGTQRVIRLPFQPVFVFWWWWDDLCSQSRCLTGFRMFQQDVRTVMKRGKKRSSDSWCSQKVLRAHKVPR